MNANGTNPVNLSKNPTFDEYHGWSPDGAKVLFSSNRDGNWDLYVVKRNGKDIARLTHNPPSELGASWFDPRFPVPEQKRLLTLWATLKRKL